MFNCDGLFQDASGSEFCVQNSLRRIKKVVARGRATTFYGANAPPYFINKIVPLIWKDYFLPFLVDFELPWSMPSFWAMSAGSAFL